MGSILNYPGGSKLITQPLKGEKYLQLEVEKDVREIWSKDIPSVRRICHAIFGS
jgi:hypothetical protein